MKTYNVTITVTVTKVITVEAPNEDAATEAAYQDDAFDSGECVRYDKHLDDVREADAATVAEAGFTSVADARAADEARALGNDPSN